MAICFNAEEIFKIGLQIELNGKAFYHAAAAGCKSDEVQKLILKLRDQEDMHYRVFSEMLEALPAEAKAEDLYDPDGQSAAYLGAIAGSHIFTSEMQAADLAKQCETEAEVIHTAIRFEKDSVLLFESMKEVTKPEWGQDKINGLIDAEKHHVRQLSAELAKLTSQSP